MKLRSSKLTLILILIVFTFACNLPTNAQQNEESLIFTQAAQTVTAVAQIVTPTSMAGIQTFTPFPINTNVPSPSAPQQTATNTALPCNMASFVADITIPDNTNITVNKAFTKTWTLANVGSCTWTSGYQLIFDSGDQMNGPASQQLTGGTVAPGQTLDVSINLVAPSSPGTYKGNWKIREPGGTIFGLSTGPFWVQIKAVAAAAADWPTFKNGDAGSEVFAIQHLLNANGSNLNVDGIFGPLTQSNVEDFQTDNNLSEDAIVGPETWKVLIVQVSQGKEGPAVRAVQKLLKDKFGYNINIDGIFGPATASAVKDFQTAKGLTADGIVGPKTWQKLISK